MKPEELEKMPLRVEKLFYELQNRVMADVVRRIEKTGRITSTADYQLEKVRIFGSSSEFIESEIKRLTGASDEVIWQLYEDAVDKDYTRNKSLYEQVNTRFIPYDENEVMQSWVNAVVSQTKNEISNITQSMGFSISMGGNKKVFTPLSEYYQKYLDAACMDIVTGSFSYNTVLRRVVKEMTASGIRTVDYASGWSNRATVASRRAVMTGVNQLCGKINDRNAEQLKTDYFEVTAHANARPAHRNWQGQVYSRKQLAEICGLGSVDGLEGANCRHQHLAFVPGVSVRTYTDIQLAEMARKEDITKEWRGKSYKGYEATQEQRHMETIMRKQRADVKLLQQGKADAEEINAAKARYLNTLHQYQAFSRKMGLPEQMERVYMDGLGRIINTRSPVVKPPSRGIIKSGAISGARNPYGEAANEHAKKYYGLVRSMKTDVAKIAKTTGISEKQIQSIKDYLFVHVHDLGEQGIKRFDPDYMIAESWRRLIDGKPDIHDMTLLKHEILEKDLMSKGMTQDEAHTLATAKYNYAKEAGEYYGKIDKYKKG